MEKKNERQEKEKIRRGSYSHKEIDQNCIIAKNFDVILLTINLFKIMIRLTNSIHNNIYDYINSNTAITSQVYHLRDITNILIEH